MLSRKDFPSPTKPLYGSGFSQKNVEAPDLATVKDFFRFCAATDKGKIVIKLNCGTGEPEMASIFMISKGTLFFSRVHKYLRLEYATYSLTLASSSAISFGKENSGSYTEKILTYSDGLSEVQ
jgi:hypothetical protein